MNILIVDDRPSNLKLLRAVLEIEGTTVCEAANGVEALGVLKRVGVDAIISDILMPRMDGYRLCMEVRASPRSCDVPFIAYSATYTSGSDEKLMIEMGADRFLRKPASAAVLAATLQEVVLSKRRRPPSSARTRPEVELLKDYNQRVVVKLEEKNTDLAAKIEQLTQAEDDDEKIGVWTDITERKALEAEDGGPEGVGAIVVEITESKQAELALPEQREPWHTCVAMSANAVLVFQDEKLVHANPTAVRLLGAASEEDLKGRSLTDFLPEGDGAAIAAQARLGLQPRENPRPLLEQTIRRLDGSRVEIEASSALFQFRGRPALLVEARDLSDRKRAESRRALQHAITATLAEAASPTEIHQKILATLGGGLKWDLGELWIIEPSAHVLSCTETWHLPAIQFHEFAAKSLHPAFATGQGLPGRVWASGRTEWCTDLLRDTVVCPRRNQASSMGLLGWIGFPIKFRKEVVGVVGFFSRKLTRPDAELLALLDDFGLQIGQFIERQQLADQFRQAQKMDALGTLAGGIAHDFNNILSAIYGYCELARMEMTGNLALNEHLDGLMGGARRATALVQQILAFSCHQEEERRPIQLRHVASEAMRLLRAAVPATIEFQTSLAKDTPVVLADATQVHQILMNLGTNAAHAMRERGGRMIVTLEDSVVDGKLAATHPDLRAGLYARLTVRDNGHGMDVETRERVFEPFFTTKPPGEGTGLGLTVVQAIVKSHEGAITVSSRLGEGTTFQVYFPAHLVDADKAVIANSRLPRGGGERILFVDDEFSVADVGKQLLNRIGYLTDTCTNAGQALQLVSADPSAYALVITDHMMPGMTGTDLALRLNAIRPDLPIILTTGYTASLQPDRLLAMGIRQLLAKPLSMHALATAVHQALCNTVVRESLGQPCS